jgi:uncharacterized protein involved in exopolysaccharide biosynthesis
MTEETAFRLRARFIASRWRFLVLSVAAASLLAFAISEFLPRRYTATSTVIVDPPATNDPRTTTALNPGYLDSLSTFEHYFTSDTLFQQAAQRFHLDAGEAGIVALRQKVLKVSMQRQTRILQVSATLPSPKDAIALVQYITDQGIATNRERSAASDRDILKNVSEELDRARARIDKARADWEKATRDDTPETLRTEVGAAIGLLTETRRLHEQADAEAAEWRIRARDGDPPDRQSGTILANAAGARADEYDKRERDFAEEIATKRKLVAERTTSHAVASAELDSAQRSYDAAFARVRDYSALTGLHSERLRVIDPGVEPQEPSSPQVLLNTIAAALLAACMAIAWINLMAGMPGQRPAVVRTPAPFHEERSLSR